jgi:hypothetical protein
MLSRAAWLLVGLAVAVTGCGTTRRTLAQDLAWERWTTCTHHSEISLSRIDPDGRVWVSYNSADHTLAFNAWNDCMRKAAVEQGRRGGDSVPAPVSAAELWTMGRIEPLDGVPHYVVTTGSREIFYRVSDFAFTKETLDGDVVRLARPAQWRWVDFPLVVGKSWDMKWVDERAGQPAAPIERRCVAEALEKVTVPAGIFPTIRIRCRDVGGDGVLQTMWYAPGVRHFVRGELILPSGREVRELIGFKLR